MLFNSSLFVAFFVVVFCVYWLLRTYHRPQNVLLLIASYVFYGAWSWNFLALLIASTVFDYVCGLLIEGAAGQRRKRIVLIASVVFNLTLLGIFKYAGFFVREAAELLEWLGFQANVRTLEIVLPVGISFYTFQTLSYVIDVYRGKLPAARNLLDYSLYVAFFPQLVAGPIERATHLLPQIEKRRIWSNAAFESGLQLIVWGLFKKVVIADNLAPYVDAVYAHPEAFSGTVLLTATVFFAFQIYCDFSGYTDTARGVARMLGFELMLNFDRPYFSRTPVEFWGRWHISLSKWFQDYLYFPMAMHYMRKGGWASKYKAHIIAMTLIGFWHGANWTFIIFGLYWGLVIALYLELAERAASAPAALRRLLAGDTALAQVFSVLLMFTVVCIGWVFFRATSIQDAWYILTHLFTSSGQSAAVGSRIAPAALLWTLVLSLMLAELLSQMWPAITRTISERGVHGLILRHAMFVAAAFCYLVIQSGKPQAFIYFQF